MVLYGLGEETASFLVGGFGIGGITLESMASVEPVIHTQRGKSRLVVFSMVTDNGHTPAVNKAVTIQISQDAGAYADTVNAVGELGTGLYYILLTDSELDATVIAAIISAAGCRSKVLIIYTDDNETKLIQIQTKTDKHPADLASEITLIKGALGFNCVLDDFIHDVNGKATSGTVYIYDSIANAKGHVASSGPGLLKKLEGVAIITSGNTTRLTRTEAWPMDLLGVMSGGFDTDKKTTAGSGIDIVVVSKLEGTISVKNQLTGSIKTVSQLIGTIEGNMKSSDIELYRGDSRTLEVTVSDENGPTNLTGATVKFSVKKKKSDTAYIIKKSTDDPSEVNIVDAINGKLEIYLTPDDTQGVGIASYHYDVEVTTSTNKVYTVVIGKLTVLQELTRPDF